MSIIYDALKKSQKARATQPQPARIQLRMRAPRLPRIKIMKMNRKNMIMTLLILTSLFIMVMMLTAQEPPGAKRLFAQQQFVNTLSLPKAKLASSTRLMLEGVFPFGKRTARHD